jgi:hypothetical protein
MSARELLGDELLHEILSEVRALRAEFRAAVPNRRARSEGDEELLRLILEATEGRKFSAFELIDHLEIADAAPLRAALLAVAGSLSTMKVGKLLQRLERLQGDIILERVGRDRLGVVWCASRASAHAHCRQR